MDITKLMKQAKEMQNNLQKVDVELNNTEYSGNSNEMVTCVLKGNNELVSIDIKEEMLTNDNKDVLQDMICLAVNQAVEKAKKEREERMNSLTAGVNIPGIR